MNSQFTKVGLPILVLLVGGSVGLSYMVQGKFTAGPKIKTDKSDKYKKEQKEFNLEDELHKMEEKVDVENWKYKKIPGKQE